MSNTDSFIDEVSEEVRRDRLNRMLRKYGWIVLLVVFVAVGAAAANEWWKARVEAQAAAFGGEVDAALQIADPERQAAALEAIPAEGQAAVATGFLAAAAHMQSEDYAAAIAVLEGVGDTVAGDDTLTGLTALKLVAALAAADRPVADRFALLDPLIAAENPFYLLLLEQRGIAHLADANPAAALSDFEIILRDTELTAPLRDRVQTLVVALGGEIPSRAQIVGEEG